MFMNVYCNDYLSLINPINILIRNIISVILIINLISIIFIFCLFWWVNKKSIDCFNFLISSLSFSSRAGGIGLLLFLIISILESDNCLI